MPPDFSKLSLPFTLGDGTPVTLRAVRDDDAPKIRRAFHTLGPETIHARFFDHRADVTEAELMHIIGVNFRRDVALLVTIGAGEDEIVIGGVSYFALDGGDPPLSAELAFTIVDGYQGRGMGNLLMQQIVAIARANGLTYLEADTLADNLAMLHVFGHSGLPMVQRWDGDIAHVRLEVKGGSHDLQRGPPAASQDVIKRQGSE